MDTYSAYAYSTAAWLSLQALPLFVSPKLIITLLSPDARTPTDLETYLSRTLSLTLLTLALLNILLSGALPLSSPVNEAEHSPYKGPAALISTTFHISSLVYVYVNYMATGSVCFMLAMVGSGFLGCFGVWCLLFGGEESGKSRVSGWPFRNEEERKAKREKMARKRL
ncbi:hypothetical protein OEA41_007514 [Lepraria neglecta]|uniref:Uncharacterized protein n=1 Tax=Lepraria neglecta TaxID=209136 RepID=A0AAD9ZCU2_9LECA|nr:hypothetical protein OEA41_007514 [Lepraria neglecta]